MSTILLHRGGKTTTPFADAPDMWPPNSPDLNPVDFAVWGALQQMVYHQQRFDSVDELKRAIVKSWDKPARRFSTGASANGVVVLPPWCSRMVDISSTNSKH